MKLSPITATLTSLLLVASIQPAATLAQNVQDIECHDGDVLSGRYENVFVNGGSCTLYGATVFGAVMVYGGSLTTTANGAEIYGGVQVKDGGSASLMSADVDGAVTLEQGGNLFVGAGSRVRGISAKDSGDVTIAPSASAGEVLLANSGDVAVGGSVAAVFSTDSGAVTLTNATVFPGGVTLVSGDSLEICGSSIGVIDTLLDGSGSVTVLESGDVLAVAEGSCGPSVIDGSVIVQKGTGDVRFTGATLNSDLIVIEQMGDVEVDGSGCDPEDLSCAIVSDVMVGKVTGAVTLRGVTTDSDTTIVENDGNVVIDSSALGSDVAIQYNKMVTVAGSSFALEDVRISNNEGPVLIDRNCDMRPTVVENGSVMLTNNNPTDATAAGATCVSGYGFSDADVSKNTGGVVIENNSGEGLYCSDNDPAPVEGAAGNVITFSDGQCAGF